jgi:hypothetical protein
VRQIDEEKRDDPNNYYIDATWLVKWHKYVHNLEGKTPEPGPITNCKLLLDTYCVDSKPKLKLKDGLVVERDYRFINASTWFALQQVHGGGPVLVRNYLLVDLGPSPLCLA